jgi:sugar lactone lactonase YvrE
MPPPPPVSGLYVANFPFAGGNSITSYASNANGNVAPVRMISGANTQLAKPVGVALDTAGNIFVPNFASSVVTAYLPSANGNVFPIRTILHTGPTQLSGMGFDPAGNLFVANAAPTFDSINVYAPGANGLVLPPSHTIIGPSTGLSGPDGVAVDAVGNLFVVNFRGNSVTVYAPTATGNVAPSARLAEATPIS